MADCQYISLFLSDTAPNGVLSEADLFFLKKKTRRYQTDMPRTISICETSLLGTTQCGQ